MLPESFAEGCPPVLVFLARDCAECQVVAHRLPCDQRVLDLLRTGNPFVNHEGQPLVSVDGMKAGDVLEAEEDIERLSAIRTAPFYACKLSGMVLATLMACSSATSPGTSTPGRASPTCEEESAQASSPSSARPFIARGTPRESPYSRPARGETRDLSDCRASQLRYPHPLSPAPRHPRRLGSRRVP